MKTTITTILLALCCVLSAASAEITHTTLVPQTASNWVVTNDVPQFNPSLGTLDAVAVEISGTMIPNWRVENRDTVSWTNHASTTVTFAANCPGNLASLVLASSHDQELAAFDGTIDYAGPSGFTTNRVVVGSCVASTSSTGAYVGTATVPLVISGTSQASYSGSGVYRFVAQTPITATVVVRYTFTPAP